MKNLKLCAVFLLMATCMGCGGNLAQLRQAKMNPGKAEKVGLEQFMDAPSVVQVKAARNAFVLNEPVAPSGEDIVKLEFNKASLQEIAMAVSRAAHLNILIENREGTPAPTSNGTGAMLGPVQPSSAASSAPGSITLTFQGKTKDLFQSLSRAAGYFFVSEGDTVFVRKDDVFSVVLPVYPKLLESVETSIKEMGASSVSYDTVTSTMSFRADYNAYTKIKRYLQILKDNASLITMRVVLVDLSLNKEHSTGIDWTKLTVGKGALEGRAGLSGSSSSTTGSGSTSSSAGVAGSGYAALFNGTGVNLLLSRATTDISAIFNFMESFGDYKVVQNVSVLAMSGKEGKLEVLRETPYVSQISVANLTVGSSSTGQTAQTDKAKDGVEISILPQYNRADGTLGLALKVGVFGVTRYVDLSAGNQLGSLTLPETTKKTIDTYLRMTPQQIAVIGGLISERSVGEASGLPGESRLLKNDHALKSKSELVVIVKPTIIEFVN